MRCQCIICTDDFDHAADIACLPCGHTFHQSCLNHWIGGNPTCPTCRCRVKLREVRKVYLTSLDSTIVDDPGRLQSDLAATKLEVLELRQRNVQSEEALSKLKALLEKSEANLGKTKNKYREAVQKIESLEPSLRMMKGTLKENASLKDMVADLQNTIEKSSHLKRVLQGTEKEVEELLKLYGPSSSSVKQIALYCVSLKRELETAKNEVRVSRDQIKSANRKRLISESELAKKIKELSETAADVVRYREQCFVLTEKLENLPERQAGSALSSKRLSGEGGGGPEERVKRTKSIVPSPPVLKPRVKINFVDGDSVKNSLTKALPGYTKMKITPALRKPEAPAKTSSQDELLLNLMRNKLKTSDKDSIQRKGYNGLGGHSSHIQTAKR